ncbi:unnamed protein product [Amoebophrya sp. A120]|nr:unnamed protein product [Amoebophrya sp. A120]|eukprot:GSA120T00017425001.1
MKRPGKAGKPPRAQLSWPASWSRQPLAGLENEAGGCVAAPPVFEGPPPGASTLPTPTPFEDAAGADSERGPAAADAPPDSDPSGVLLEIPCRAAWLRDCGEQVAGRRLREACEWFSVDLLGVSRCESAAVVLVQAASPFAVRGLRARLERWEEEEENIANFLTRGP